MNRNKNYVCLVRIGYLLTVISAIGLTVSFYFKQVPLIFVTNVLTGLLSSSIFGPIFEISTQHTYPRATDFVLSCLVCGFFPLVIILSEVYRLVLNYFDGLILLVVYSMSYVCGLFLALILKPEYRRLEAELKESTEYMETQALLNSNEVVENFEGTARRRIH